MEELVSTDNIHREILEDARRKAGRILKSASDSCAALSADWDAKLNGALDDVKRRYESDRVSKEAEAKARLAMDKARAKLEKTQNGLSSAMNAYLKTVERPRLLAKIESELAARLEYVARTAPDADFRANAASTEAEVCGLSAAEAGGLLGRQGLGDVRVTERPVAKSGSSETATDVFPSIVLRGKAVKLTVSIQAVADEILLDCRAQAAEALFG
jgi:vacuolar-type H+-ATPase subunit E/Vma4